MAVEVVPLNPAGSPTLKIPPGNTLTDTLVEAGATCMELLLMVKLPVPITLNVPLDFNKMLPEELPTLFPVTSILL